LRALSLCTCCRHYPGAAAGRRLRSVAQPYQPSPVRRPGRPARCPFRGLLGVHSRCGLHTRAATNSWHANRRLQSSRYLHDCSDCFRLERVRRVGFSPTGKRRLCTAHVESGDGDGYSVRPASPPNADIAFNALKWAMGVRGYRRVGQFTIYRRYSLSYSNRRRRPGRRSGSRRMSWALGRCPNSPAQPMDKVHRKQHSR
jgi:hypothetical protein